MPKHEYRVMKRGEIYEIEEKIGGGDWSPICSHSSINEIKEMLKAIKTLDEEVKNNEGK